MDLNTALILLILLQIKHMFADFYLQTPMMLFNRGLYMHTGRALHCLIHVIGSAIAMIWFDISWSMLVAVLIAEFLVHFHIDYGKGRWSDMKAHGPADAGYWRAFGVDQALHQLTYVAMIRLVA